MHNFFQETTISPFYSDIMEIYLNVPEPTQSNIYRHIAIRLQGGLHGYVEFCSFVFFYTLTHGDIDFVWF